MYCTTVLLYYCTTVLLYYCTTVLAVLSHPTGAVLADSSLALSDCVDCSDVFALDVVLNEFAPSHPGERHHRKPVSVEEGTETLISRVE